jgi:16S rRNA (guanine527-N7)-methyltransferase
VTGAAATAERGRLDIEAAIAERFGANTGLAETYAELLCTIGIDHGMIGPREADRIWERHLLNCAALAPLVPANARVIDLGSGAGLPGIPLAIARPDLEIVLLEPLLRRVRFLEDCLAQLPLPRVDIHRGRGEDGVTTRADVVVVRAVGALDAIVRMSSPLLVEAGVVLALKGEGAAVEVEQVTRGTAVQAELISVPSPGRAATVVRITGDVMGAAVSATRTRTQR